MDAFDIIGALRTAAEDKGWVFLTGQTWYQDYEATQVEYPVNQLVLGAEFLEAIPTRVNGKVTEISYPGILILGRKRETTTESNLDETFIQKYDRRLKDLTTLLSNFVSEFSCANKLDVTGENIGLRLNSLDENIDFAADLLTFLGDGV